MDRRVVLIKNPLGIHEILTHVLGYLPNNSLLQARLVNQSWNEGATKLLNKRKAICLNSRNIVTYVELLAQNSNNFRGLKSIKVRIHFPKHNKNKTESSQEEDAQIAKEENLINSVIKLLTSSSSSSSSTIELHHLTIVCPSLIEPMRQYDHSNVLHLLEMSAPKLRGLSLNNVDFDLGLSGNIQLDFPQLRSMYVFGKPLSVSTSFLSSIMHSKLKTLSLVTHKMYSGHEADGINVILRHLAATAAEGSKHVDLEKLELRIHPIETLNIIFGLKLSHLKKLILDVSSGNIDGQDFATFLCNNCPTLVSLEFYANIRDALLPCIASTLPCHLPKLTSFGFYLSKYSLGFSTQEPYHSQRLTPKCEAYLTALSKLSSCLNTIKLDYEALIGLSTFFISLGGNSGTSNGDQVLPSIFASRVCPNVSSIKIYLSLCCFGKDLTLVENQQKYLDQTNIYQTINYLLNTLFPAANYLSLQQNCRSNIDGNSNYTYAANSNLRPYLPLNLLKSVIALNGLKKLKIKNYIEDWLNQIIIVPEGEQAQTQINNVNEIIENLELLRIHGYKQRDVDPNSCLDIQKLSKDGNIKFDVLGFLDKIKAIQVIQVDEKLVQRGPDHYPSTSLESLLLNKFPNTKIKRF